MDVRHTNLLFVVVASLITADFLVTYYAVVFLSYVEANPVMLFLLRGGWIAVVIYKGLTLCLLANLRKNCNVFHLLSTVLIVWFAATLGHNLIQLLM